MSYLAALTGILIGGGYGYIAQRGAFCMNSGFRVVVTDGNTTKVKAYVLAIALQMLVVPLVFALGLSSPTYPAMFPIGAVVGGLLFGASMRWAGGCAAGVWYKVGSGSLGALAAVLGMAIGAAALELGPLVGLRTTVQTAGPSVSNAPLETLWAWAPIAGLLLVVMLWRAAPGQAGAWSWRRTGMAMGIVGILAWPLSSLAARDFGMAVVPGTVSLLTDPVRRLMSWDVLFVLGIPVGGFVAARKSGPITASKISAISASKHFAGGLGLGVGASLAAGCTVGHGLTGVPLLAPGSMLAIVSIFAGSAITSLWTQRGMSRALSDRERSA
ncbi:MAG: YeeE/YedE family protein [Deltaproteobacteria bacterium]|nr:YeeE/YedE family protein [Deltaproteobacteria bacterium]MBW2212466.1 YeeE/YedE family protein [Deltaproteobacteria bacterium]MBW2214235.1 YeeE/YedE family protein [Deltaproteobacteria bacterium]MBW2380234.1 YeeE/YedE family protein [Deltaproteobacteria bacterium]MBW2551228.1 YeeE/YedE family protein [Deltaproteobacteria bacterium]